MKTIYQVVTIKHESREVQLCGELYESREKAQRELIRLLDNPYIKGEEEPCGEVGEQKYTIVIPRTFVSFDAEVCAQRKRKSTQEVLDYCIVVRYLL